MIIPLSKSVVNIPTTVAVKGTNCSQPNFYDSIAILFSAKKTALKKQLTIIFNMLASRSEQSISYFKNDPAPKKAILTNKKYKNLSILFRVCICIFCSYVLVVDKGSIYMLINSNTII